MLVGGDNGPVVKMIGDAVMFTADESAMAAAIALDLLAAWPNSEPPLCVGVAYGAVVDRLGDVFGSTVNIASRLTSISLPGEVLVDQNMARVLRGDGRYQLENRPAATVRGYEHLPCWRLTRTP